MKRRSRIASRLRRHLKRPGVERKPDSLRRKVSAREEAQIKISRRKERLQILSDCLARLLLQRDAEKIVSDIFPRVAAHVGADAFFNYLAIPQPRGFDLLSLQGLPSEVVCDICDACSGGALSCQAAKTRSIVEANDIQHSPDPRYSRVRALGVQTCLCIPLVVEGRLLGVLSFASRSKTQFAPDEIEFLRLISGHVAIALDRARSEKLLHEREQRLQIALEAAKMGTWELEVPSGMQTPPTDEELTKALDSARPSQKLEQMMGLKPHEFRSCRDWDSRVHPDDRVHNQEALRDALSGMRPYDIEHRFVWPDGSIRWVHCRGMLFRDGGDAPLRFMGVSIDITDRKQAEEDLRLRNKGLQFISSCLAQLLAERDPDYIIADIFSQMAVHAGADVCLNFHVHADKPEEIVLHTAVGISEEIEQRVHRLRFGEGPCGMVAQTRSIVVANDIQHSTDPAADFVRNWGFQCYAGFPLVVGDRLLGTLDFAAKGKTEFSVEELDFLRLISGYVAIAVDRAQGERAILQSKEAAETASRSKDLFIAALSHELRNPLTPALMTATSLEQDDTLAPSLREQMHVVRRSVELEARLIDDLLDLTRIERGKFSLRPERVDVRELLARAMEIVRETILVKQLHLQTEIAAKKTVILGDPVRLQQVVWNLLINAIKFTPDGGNIHVSVFNPDPQILAVQIRDTGIGIARENLEKIFNPFEQCTTAGNHRYGGLGLGLGISKSIAELHGGTLTAASEGLNQGSTFTVFLPIAEKAELAPGQTKPIRPKRPIAHLHILLVEDQEQTRAVLARILSRDGHEVQIAGTCAAALEAVRSHETNPFDVLISDIGLPDGSGLNLVRQIKDKAPDIAALALSGYGTHEDVDRSFQAGFNVHLTKPIGVEELRRALATLE